MGPMPAPPPPTAPVALVTGGVRGIGLACARRLQARGDRVHVGYFRSAERAAALEPELGGRLHRADLRDPDQVERLVAAVVARDGRLDHVVHAVGDYACGPLEGLGLAELRELFASNLETSFLVAAAARPHLRASAGRLVCFGTAGLEGLRAKRETAAYAAAKSALLVLVRSLAVEEAPHGVTVNLVSPGLVPHEAAHPAARAAAGRSAIPAGRPGRPEDVAAAVAWLCSPDSAYTTGSNLVVSGAWML